MKNKSTFNTWPVKFGFISGLGDCVGKAIESVENIKMPYGCTWSSALAVKFSDGERAFFVGGYGSGCQSPDLSEMEKSRIFTAEEVGQVAMSNRKKKEETEAKNRKQKLQQIERLQRELGEVK